MQEPFDYAPQIQTHNFSVESKHDDVLNLVNKENTDTLFYTEEVQNNYKFLKGKLVLAGKQPDGDSVGFTADDSRNYNSVYRSYLLPPGKRDGSARSVQLRLEGIDSPELHYNEDIQPLAKEARDYLLEKLLGFSPVYKPAANAGQVPMLVESSQPESVSVCIATSAIDPNGRPISYVFNDITGFGEGEISPLDPTTLVKSLNYKMVEAGWAYLLAYSSMPFLHFQIFKQAANNARANKLGIWGADFTRSFVLSGKTSIEGLAAQLIYPKLFRRCIDFLKKGEGDLREWLRKTGDENDLVRITEHTTVHLSCLIQQAGDTIFFQADTNDIIFIEK